MREEDDTFGQEDLADVLTEFHKRVMTEPNQSTGVPAPFQIATSVQSLHPMQFQEPRTKEEPMKTPKVQGAPPETAFDLGQNHYEIPTDKLPLWMQLSCHDSDVNIDPMEFVVVAAIWQGNFVYGTPQSTGTLTPRWDYSNYWPAVRGAPPTIAKANWYYQPGLPGIAHKVFIQLALRHTTYPYDYAKTFYLTGERQDVWTVHNEAAIPYIYGWWWVN
jgi:hypothetical protein